MKRINDFIQESMNNDDKMTFAIITYLLKKANKQDRIFVLERVDDVFLINLGDFFNEAKFENIPDLLGGESAETLASYFDDITEEEINKLIR